MTTEFTETMSETMNDLNVFELPVFADANIWSMWPADKLNDLAEDIKENGFDHRYPITIAEVNGEWMLLDGRNRREAAKLAGIVPPVIVTDVDPKLAVHRSNNQNRDATPGQKAMAFAMAFPEGMKGGRGNKLLLNGKGLSGTEQKNISYARYVRKNNPIAEGKEHPKICHEIMDGLLTLSEAYESTQIDVKRREAEEALRQEKAAKLMDVRNRYPDLAALVDDERISLSDAIASAESRDIEEQKKAERAAFEAAEQARLAKEEEDRIQAEEEAKLAEEDRKKREQERLKKEEFDRNQIGVHQYLDQLINATCVAVNATQVEQTKKHLDWDAFAARYRHKRADAIRVITALSQHLPELIKILENAA